MLAIENMRDEAMRLAKQAGLSFFQDGGPAAPMLAKAGLRQSSKPVAVDPERLKVELEVLERLDARGLRIPAMFAQ